MGNKIDRFEKEQVAVPLNGNGEIVWAVGIRADERFGITAPAGNMLMISVNY